MSPQDPYGLSRVVNEPGVLPQQAQRLDAALPCREDELLIDVDSLNIDAASLQQIKGEVGRDPAHIAERVKEIVRTRGKMHNPVTGSGGMLMGRVREIGARHPAIKSLKVGDRIATLVSLSLTPLHIEEVLAVDPTKDRVDIRGHALLFATGLYAKLPSDFPDALSLAALDVCGAPALVARHAKPGMRVAVIGAGKSGALCLAQAKRIVGSKGHLLAMDISLPALESLQALGLCDAILAMDATRAVPVLEAVQKLTGGELCDLVINCASVANTEMATLLTVREGGTALFFSMATRFTAAALGAEGVGKDVTMLVGNGYVPGHAELTLQLLREEPLLRSWFEKRFVAQ